MEGIVEFSRDQELCVTLPPDTKFPGGKTEGYTLKYLWTNTTFERMKEATEDLQNESQVNYDLRGWILDPPEIKNNLNRTDQKALDLLRGSSRKIGGLNRYQLQAIYRALEPEPLTLIQGPPGTGKTITLTAIIYLLLKTIPKDKKILVCAPSNIAVDNLAEELNNLGIQVLRMYSRTREMSGEIRESLTKISLHEMIIEGKSTDAVSLKSLTRQKQAQVWLSKNQQREFKRLREKRESGFIKPAQVVCCTCITAGDPRLDNSIYEYVVVDEAAQALESETLIPLKYKAKKLILAGDHKQLGPLVKSKQVKEANFGQSLFERLAQRVEPTVLLEQYRMHPLIAVFPSQKFYNNLLETAPGKDSIAHPLFPWPNDKPAFFYDVVGREEEPPYKESYFNRLEASFIAKLIYRLTCSGIKPGQIAIITPYSAQKEFFNELFAKILKDQMLQKIEVASIDGFQGREKDYIIISCVRSNQEIGIGFLNDERRLNVAITRAKLGMVIVGNAQVLAQDPLWKELLKYYQSRELLVCGDLSKLKQSDVRL